MVSWRARSSAASMLRVRTDENQAAPLGWVGSRFLGAIWVKNYHIHSIDICRYWASSFRFRLIGVLL